MEQSQTALKDHIRGFFEYLDLERGLANKSQETYIRLLNQFLRWLHQNNLDDLKPHDLTEEHIWQYRVFLSRHINSKTKEPLKRSTQNYYLIALRNLFKYFTDRGIICLPADKIKLAKSKSHERTIKFLSLEQVKKLLDAPRTSTNTGLRDRAILEAFFSTGLRVAELVSLNQEQFRITPETQDTEIVIVGKGNRTRPVYFSKRAVEWLRKYLKTRKDDEKALFINYKGPAKASKRLTSRSVENIVKKYALSAGIPNFTSPHTLRHSFATDLLTQGVDLREVQEFLGHKNISTTQIYVHVTSKRLRETHRKFHSFNE
ncbi:MAG: tyrosine-type recombinase/integrase [Patescibacteria group bacterium]